MGKVVGKREKERERRRILSLSPIHSSIKNSERHQKSYTRLV
jgi:hypothetical protein